MQICMKISSCSRSDAWRANCFDKVCVYVFVLIKVDSTCQEHFCVETPLCESRENHSIILHGQKSCLSAYCWVCKTLGTGDANREGRLRIYAFCREAWHTDKVTGNTWCVCRMQMLFLGSAICSSEWIKNAVCSGLPSPSSTCPALSTNRRLVAVTSDHIRP